MRFTAHDGREWSVHAVKAQLDRLDFAPRFQMSHPKAFEAAQKIAALKRIA